MLKFLLVVCFFSLNALADQTCSTQSYDFRITDSYIEAQGRGLEIKVPYHQMRSLSQNSRGDFKALLKRLSDITQTDEPLSLDEASRLYRFSITVADDVEELITLKYIKGYDESGILVVRFMINQDRAYRCL
jgi:hypothetical protein